MDWLIQYGEQIVVLVILALVVGVGGYVRYWSTRDRLWRDLEGLVEDGLDYLKVRSKEQLAAVTTEDIKAVSAWLYEHCVQGTALAKVVTEERLYDLVLEAFVYWRDRFVSMDQAMAASAAVRWEEG